MPQCFSQMPILLVCSEKVNTVPGQRLLYNTCPSTSLSTPPVEFGSLPAVCAPCGRVHSPFPVKCIQLQENQKTKKLLRKRF